MSLVAAGTLALALFAPPRDERFERPRKKTPMNHPIPLRPSFPRADEQSVVPKVRNAFAFVEPAPWSRWREAIRSSRFVELLGWAPPPLPGHAVATEADAAPKDEYDSPVARVETFDTSSRAFAEEVERFAATTLPAVERGERLPDLDAIPVKSADAATLVSEALPRELREESTGRTAEATVSDRPQTQPPLTRLPLRAQRSAVSWPLLLPNPRETASEAERLELLASFTRSGAAAVPEAPLCTAYREEAAAGRILALRALANANGEFASEIVREAARYGSDEERTIAIDALADCGDREALAIALSDRVDAIAARAALGYVGTFERADYERALAPLVAKARLDAILALLAGILT